MLNLPYKSVDWYCKYLFIFIVPRYKMYTTLYNVRDAWIFSINLIDKSIALTVILRLSVVPQYKVNYCIIHCVMCEMLEYFLSIFSYKQGD